VFVVAIESKSAKPCGIEHMNTTFTALMVFACLIGAVLLGRILRRLLPEGHLTADSRDAIKLAVGLVATMSALVLGLLVS
jgi:hypothetical protein